MHEGAGNCLKYLKRGCNRKLVNKDKIHAKNLTNLYDDVLIVPSIRLKDRQLLITGLYN